MKRSLLIACIAVLAATNAFAFGGSVGVFENVAGASCTIIQPAANGTYQPAIVHTGFDQSTGCSFQALNPSCSGSVFLTDISLVGVYSGTSQIGASAGYGACVNGGPKGVATMFMQVLFDIPGQCCVWTVTRHPGLIPPTVISTDCSPVIQEEPAAGGTAFLREAETTNCDCNVPTRESTWGGVKELFRTDI